MFYYACTAAASNEHLGNATESQPTEFVSYIQTENHTHKSKSESINEL